MANLSSLGVGSGLDIASLVSQLVAAERAPAQTRLSTAQSRINVQLSAIGTFKGALSDVRSKLDALRSGALATLKATSTRPETFTASASAAAVAGEYEVEVVALARAHKLVSGAYLDGAGTVLANGDIDIQVGGASFTVTLRDGSNTLADLRRLINEAADNTGVSATLVNETGGTRLLLTATATGLAHQISVDGMAFAERQAAADAHLRIEGFDYASASNTVTGAIDGVTLDLVAAEPGVRHRLVVAQDHDAAHKAISAFVNAYNAAVNTIHSLTRYDADKRQAAPLTGDITVRGAMQALRGVLGTGNDGGALRFLSEIGIATQTDGTLKLDASALTDALKNDGGGVAQLFAGEGGYAERLIQVLDGIVGDDGQVSARTDSLQTRLQDLTRQQDALDLRMQRVESRYRAQFTALDTLIAQMNGTSSYLTQQLASLNLLTAKQK
ncbi:flagellar filament capping protein FliD [Sinimarinibacterium thermocellulolyticum]|uniref:Flagellar hook-associated protein 2 n=1 Tax=Sinimarinibacterium thermocellulolyticum TaxID=3170016 RepID=A0ABV2ACJ1_9GAMM